MNSSNRTTIVLLLTGAAALLAGARPASAAWRESDEKMVDEVVERLKAVIKAPDGYDWPPPVHKVDADDVNAFCGNAGKPGGRVEPHVVVFRGIMEKVVDGHP